MSGPVCQKSREQFCQKSREQFCQHVKNPTVDTSDSGKNSATIIVKVGPKNDAENQFMRVVANETASVKNELVKVENEPVKVSDKELRCRVLGADLVIVPHACPDGQAVKLLLRDARSREITTDHKRLKDSPAVQDSPTVQDGPAVQDGRADPIEQTGRHGEKRGYGGAVIFRHYTTGVTEIDARWAEALNGRHVLCIGCRPKLAGVELMDSVAKSVTVIDHQKHLQQILSDKIFIQKGDILRIKSPGRCSAACLYALLFPDEKLPDWLRVIDSQVSGRFGAMSADDRAAHAALTDDLEALDACRTEPWPKLVERGRFLMHVQRPMVAAALISKVLVKKLIVKGASYQVAYVHLPHEKFMTSIIEQFWTTSSVQPSPVLQTTLGVSQAREPIIIDVLAMWMSLPCNRSDFKLRRHPNSTLDLAELAKLYDGGGHPHAAAIQLQNSPKFIPNVE
jgi:hypothetical protein